MQQTYCDLCKNKLEKTEVGKLTFRVKNAVVEVRAGKNFGIQSDLCDSCLVRAVEEGKSGNERTCDGELPQMSY